MSNKVKVFYFNLFSPLSNYKFVYYEEVYKYIEYLVNSVCETLALTYNQSCTLLRSFKWDRVKAQDRYLTEIDDIRKKLGFDIEMIKNNDKMCYICCEEYDDEKNFYSLECGHKYCVNCWRILLINEVNKGTSCINVKCPEEKCQCRISDEVFKMFLDEEHWNRYLYLLAKSFIYDCPDFKECTGVDCKTVCYYPGGGSYNVCCPVCKTIFCFKCGTEPHKPATCSMVVEWNKKNRDDAENVKWLTANTKQCPKCHTNIEKNQGCNHMTCNKSVGGCGYEFCWLYN